MTTNNGLFPYCGRSCAEPTKRHFNVELHRLVVVLRLQRPLVRIQSGALKNIIAMYFCDDALLLIESAFRIISVAYLCVSSVLCPTLFECILTATTPFCFAIRQRHRTNRGNWHRNIQCECVSTEFPLSTGLAKGCLYTCRRFGKATARHRGHSECFVTARSRFYSGYTAVKPIAHRTVCIMVETDHASVICIAAATG